MQSITAEKGMARLTAVVAAGPRGEIGMGGTMPWHLPEDLAHFKALTMGRPVVMGRATWLSLPRRPLPGRRNIVLSRDPHFRPEGAETAASPEEALALCGPGEEPVVIGGAKVYEAMMPLTSRIVLTRVAGDWPGADTFFPEIDPEEWELADETDIMKSRTGLGYRFETYERRDNQQV